MGRPFVSLHERGYRIILISGKALSGKGSLAKILSTKYNFIPIGFADDLKNFAAIYFGISREELFEKKTKLSRIIMQGLGMLFRDQISEDYWIKRVEQKILNLKNYKRIVIPDCRFMNELEWGIKNGCFSVKVIRENNPEIEANPEHPSETELDNLDDNSWDWVITNKFTENWRKRLEIKTDELVHELVEKGWITP